MQSAARLRVSAVFLVCVLAVCGLGCTPGPGMSGGVPTRALTVEGAQARTFDVLVRRAQAGDGEAMFLLGVAYERGELGLVPDMPRAAYHYERAVSLGSTRARVLLARLLNHGHGVEADPEAAFRHFLAAAVQGLSVAQASVGAMYAQGRGAARDDVEAYAWLAAVSARRDAEVLPALQVAAEHMRGRLLADMPLPDRPRALSLAARYFEAFGGVQPPGTAPPSEAVGTVSAEPTELLERAASKGSLMYRASVRPVPAAPEVMPGGI